MNKHLNNFLNKTEGLPEETSNNNIRKEMARQLGSVGGKKLVQKRFQGKSKEEISEMMHEVRYSKKDLKTIDIMANELVDNLNKNVKNS